MVEYQHFLKEYKSDPSQAACVACNRQQSCEIRSTLDAIDFSYTITKFLKTLMFFILITLQ
jgi:hypothetical protein